MSALVILVAGAGAIGVIWGGYPLLIALLARRRARTASAPGSAPATATAYPRVTVVLASREPADAIAARIDDLLAADYPAGRLDVVVALDRDVDVPTQALEGAAVRVHRADTPGGKASALNTGVRIARGDILVFTDTHQRFATDAIARLVARFADARIGAVSGILDTAAGASRRLSPAERYWRYERRLRQDEAIVHSTVGVTGAVWAMRRALWAPLPAGLILDDVFTPMRLVLDGWRVDFAGDARATDLRRFAPEQEYRRKVRTLTGVLQLCAWLPGVLVPLRNPIWFQFVCHKLLRLLTPWLLLATLAGAGVIAFQVAMRVPRYAVPAALAATAGVLAWRRARQTVRRAVVWVVALQAAVVVATANGMRGRWNVWSS